VVVGMFIEQATPFLEEYLDKIVAQDYPKSSLHLFIHNKVRFLSQTADLDLFCVFQAAYHAKQMTEFIAKQSSEYLSIKIVPDTEEVAEDEVRNKAMYVSNIFLFRPDNNFFDVFSSYCLEKKCDYLFVVDAIAHLDNKESLKILMQQNK
jgi:procollagen-lysine,2-oxoglutarate 5-dioxygenase, invertebrate